MVTGCLYHLERRVAVLTIILIKKLIAALTALIALLSAQPKLGAIVAIATTTPVAIIEKPCIVVGRQGINYFENLTTHKISTTTSTEAEYDALATKKIAVSASDKYTGPATNLTNVKWLYSTKSSICK